jgi:hypothetical protein
MPDTQSPNPVNQTESAATERPGSGLAGLKKMSTTAGLGSGDYAAVSAMAIVALVVSLLGGFALINEYLAAFSIAGVVCAVLALRQISRSNGTQTGREFAWVAIIIGLGVTGWVVGSRVVYEMRTRTHKDQILQLISSLDAASAKADYRAGYQLFSKAFKERVPEDQFVRTLTGGPGFGNLTGITWNNEIVFFEVTSSGPRSAVAGGLLRFRLLNEAVRQPIEFVREDDGSWRIQDMSVMFPPPRKQ